MTTLPHDSEFDQLLDEFLARQRRNEKPDLGEYIARYPQWKQEIEQCFPAIAAMEDLGRAILPVGSADTAQVPKKLGDYRILREVGRGGMGVVYEAVQESLGRHVALKVLPPGQFSSGVPLQRFVREAQTAARLHHTNIVPVFGVGADQGTYFYAMQFIHGHGLDVVFQDITLLRGSTAQAAVASTLAESSVALVTQEHQPTGPITLQPKVYYRNIARLLLQAAEALAYAHSQGVLHRDIKPSNLMLDAHSTLWITDFGLAKSEGSDDLSNTGDLVGTLRYMAPERLQGQSSPLSDVYSLGVTLYEMLALKPAYGETERGLLLDAILKGRCEELSIVEPAIPRDLATITSQAMQREPRDRYTSAQALADDLRRWLDDRSILARPPGTLEKAWKWATRNPAWAMLVAVLVIGLFSTSLLSYWALRSAETARQETQLKDQALQEATTARREATRENQIATAVKSFLLDDLLMQNDAFRQADIRLEAGDASEDLAQTTLQQMLDRAAALVSKDKIDKKFPDQPLVQAELLLTIGDCYRSLHLHPQAISHYERAISLYQSEMSDEHLITLICKNSLASSLSAQGKRLEAIALLESLHATFLRLKKEDHPVALAVAGHLADAYLSAGRTQAALHLLEKLRQEDAKKPDTEGSLNRLISLGDVYLELGRLDEAITLYLRVRGEFVERLGRFHPSTQLVTNNLANAYDHLAQYDKSLPLHREILEIRIKSRGASHPDTLTSMSNLALTYQQTGRLKEAIEMMKQVTAKMITVYGKDHPDTLIVQNNLAGLLTHAHEHQEALELAQQVYRLREAKWGKNHRDTLKTVQSIGYIYWNSKQYDKAITLFEDALPRYQKEYQDLHPETIRAAINLAVNYQYAGRLDDAAKVMQEWLPRARQVQSTALLAVERAMQLEEARQGDQATALRAEWNTLKAKAAQKRE